MMMYECKNDFNFFELFFSVIEIKMNVLIFREKQPRE